MPEIGPPGSESGGRKRAHGNRPAARLRKHRMSHRPPYRLRASPRLYTNLVATLRWVSSSDVRQQIQFINQLFDVAA